MGTEKDFRVKKGLVVENGDVTLTSGNIELASGYADIDNIRIDGNAITSQNTDGNIDLTPNGTGEVNITKVDIGSGAIDGTTIGASSAGAGTFTTLTANNLLDVNAGATITGDTTDEITLDIQGVASQSVDALRIRDSDGNVDFNVSNAGVTTAASLVATTADINAGTVDNATIGVTTAAAGNFSTIGATSTGTIAGTTIDASTDFTVGSTVITDDSIVMTPSTSDTVTMAASTNGAFALTTVDDAGANGNIILTADGQMRLIVATGEQIILGTGAGNQVTIYDGKLSPVADNDIDLGADNKEYKDVWVEGLVTSGSGVHLGYGANSKLNTITTGVEVTGTLDATSTVYGGGFKSSLEQASAGTGVDLDSSATFRTKEDGGVYSHGDVIAGGGAKVTTENMENTNFRTSRLVTETGTIAAGTLTTLLYINLDNTSNNKYHAVEVECAFQEKITSTNVRTRWLSQKLYACYDGNTVHFRQDNSRFSNSLNDYAPGEFCAGLWNDGNDKYLTISATLYEAKSSSDRTATFSVNANALSMPVAIDS